jgi:putative transcriptional regulator
MTAITKKLPKSGGSMVSAHATDVAAVAAAAIASISDAKVRAHVARKPTPKSSAFEAIHSAAAGLHKVGAIDQVTMRHFNAACLTQPEIEAKDIKQIRSKNKLSQSVFAAYLGTSASTVKQWETGVKHPSGMARTLLNAIKKHGIGFLT